MSKLRSQPIPVIIASVIGVTAIIMLGVAFWMWVTMLISGAMWINFGILGAYGYWQMLPVAVVLQWLILFINRKR